MVYESDFYTTRRPYRASPSYSTYTVSSAPSRQVRILPGLGKVHVIHTYDRIVPYVGHKRLTVVTVPPKVYSTRPSILQREYDWIENKVRPWVGYSATNRYLNSDSAVRYVYARNPITGIKVHSEYIPSRYYNFYRITRPSSLTSLYDDDWPYYRPLSLYSNYWPVYRSLKLLDDDFPAYRSLRLQRVQRELNRYDFISKLNIPPWYLNYYYPSTSNYDYFYYPKPYINSDYYSYYYYNYLKPSSSISKRSDYWLKYLPISYHFYFNRISSNYANYLNYIFDDETRLIRAQTASLLKRVHSPVPRIRSWPITPLNRSGNSWSLPTKYSNSSFIHRLVSVSPNTKVEYSTYYTEPVRKYIGQSSHLSCVSYAGDKCQNRRRPIRIYKDPVQNDIQLLSYYINKFRQEKAQPKEIKVQKPLEDSVAQEIKELRDARAARLAKIYATDDAIPAPLPKLAPTPSADVEDALKAKKKKEEERLAEEKAIADENAKREAEAKKKEEAARKAELARQEELAAQAAAERAADLEKQAEKLRQEEAAKQAEIEKKKKQEEEKAKLEEQRRIEEEQKAEEERKQLERLEEIARQAEEEKEAELARQAEELAELARQEAELAELERQEREAKEKAEREAELAELAKQEAELAELERQEAELAELARQEAELAQAAQEPDAESAPGEEPAPVVTEIEDVEVVAEPEPAENENKAEEVVEEEEEEEEEEE